MPIPQQTHKNSEPVYELGNLAVMSSYIESEVGQDGLNRALQTASILQTTLDITNLIRIYSREVKDLIPHDSMLFENKQQNLKVSIGNETTHSCSYQLVAAEQSLGQLTITRKKKFTSSETMRFEYMLCSLVYPLRNAIMYKRAITAALKDPLTGVNNRSAMNTAIIRETELARRHNTPLSLVALDIDKFKNINDSYGHAAGDHVIKAIADTINECIRGSDILYRFGGEEFIILLSNTEKKGALMLAERIRHTIDHLECEYGNFKISVSASLGVTCYDRKDNTETLFEKADTALYRAKSDGRNCVRYMD